MLKNTENSYGSITKLLHWVVAIMILSLLCAGYYMTDLPNSPDKFAIYDIHKETGFLLLIIMTIRVIWRLKQIAPNLPDSTPHWQKVAASLNIKVLCFLGLAQPISGVLMTLYGGHAINIFGLFIIPELTLNKKLSSLAREFHGAFAVLLITVISLHILAALYHHFIKKDNVLKRML